MGGMFGCISAMEDSLSTLERILTTPLPLYVLNLHMISALAHALTACTPFTFGVSSFSPVSYNDG